MNDLRRLVLFAAAWLGVASIGWAQLPATQVDGLFPPGANPGAAIELTIGGEDLDDVDRLVFSHAGVAAERKLAEPTPFDDGPQPVENVFLVKVAADVPPGVYEVRANGKYGLSNPRPFFVVAAPTAIEIEPNDRREQATPATLPAELHGQSGANADVDWYVFDGKAGQRIVVEGYARRIGSRIDLALSLYDAAGASIAENLVGQSGDPILDVTLPADGAYALRVHDALYGQGPAYAYRLVVGAAPHVDFVFPPAGTPGGSDLFTVYGRNLPGGKPSDVVLEGRRLDAFEVRIATPADPTAPIDADLALGPHQAFIDGVAWRVDAAPFRSNPILVTTATAPVTREEPNDSPEGPQRLTLPCEVAGQFFPQRDADWFVFDAKKGEAIAIDLWCQRLGAPADPALLIQRLVKKEDGTTEVRDVAFVDDPAPLELNSQSNRSGRHEFDVRTSDPAYVLKPEEDGAYRILVRDGYASLHEDPRLVYRLALRAPAPDFRLVAAAGDSHGAAMLRKGGRDVIRVFAERRDGFDGEIHVTVEGLPPGVTSGEIVIGPGCDLATLVLTAAADAPAGSSAVRVVGNGLVNGAEVARVARFGGAVQAFQFNQPNADVGSVPARVAQSLMVCVSPEETTPSLLTIGGGQTFETSRGGVIKIPYTYAPAANVGGSMTGFPMGLPPNVQAQQVSVGASGEFEIRLQASTPPGNYDFYLAGFLQQMRYERNPAAAQRAEVRQQRVATILADAQKKTQDDQRLAQEKQNELNQSTGALTQATNAKTQADAAAKTAETALAQSTADRDAKKKLAAEKTDDAALAQQATEAETKLAAAQTAYDAAKLAADAMAKTLDEATTNRDAADKAKQDADAALKAAQEFQQRAQQEKQRADQFANQKKNEASPRNINAFVPSNSIRVSIADYPLKVESLAEKATVKQGEKAEVPFRIARLFGFAGDVNVQPQQPPGVGGLSLQNVNVSANQADGKFEVTAQPNATSGDHAVTVRFQMNFNGQNLVLERSLLLTVIEVPPPTQ